jgi:cell wall-associated protease
MRSLFFIALSLSTLSHAASIAVIDSGLDTKHNQIKSNLWKNSNPLSSIVHGWNFADNNNVLLDPNLMTHFSSPDITRYYEILAKQYLFQTTPADRKWAQAKQKEEGFIPLVRSYGTFMHGTHVTGISVKNSNHKAMGILLLKTNISSEALESSTSDKFFGLFDSDPWERVERTIKQAAVTQMLRLKNIGTFVNSYKMDIANGSFGTGYSQAQSYAERVYDLIAKRAPSDAEKRKAALLFLKELSAQAKMFVDAAPNTLFVFAAGNDGLNNDEYFSSPASVKANNSISVAATYKDEFLAPFSNWGVGSVDIAAPGMLIRSAVPGQKTIPVSGTSQAAPLVANIAGKVKDMNRRLSPVQIKKILMGTVDKKTFLKIRVKSGGIVNEERALEAAKWSSSMGIDRAIALANEAIPQPTESSKSMGIPVFDVAPIEMPSMFEL